MYLVNKILGRWLDLILKQISWYDRVKSDLQPSQDYYTLHLNVPQQQVPLLYSKGLRDGPVPGTPLVEVYTGRAGVEKSYCAFELYI